MPRIKIDRFLLQMINQMDQIDSGELLSISPLPIPRHIVYLIRHKDMGDPKNKPSHKSVPQVYHPVEIFLWDLVPHTY